mmetsp:Transcript_8494/g.15339  ORF Transcript_8494/g.15339 Transcript_8494/m.15339 type:complete len:242 (+) Transcript_8494:152-877(+)
MRVCGRQCTISETEPTGAWETSLRRYKAVPSHGNPGPRGQVTLYNKRKSRESPNRSNVPEWDSEVFMSELVKSESRSTAVPSSSKSVESNPVTPSLVSKAVSTMAPSSNSISQDPEKVVDLTELELRIEGALKRCSIFSQSFTYPGPEEVVLSGTFLSMRSGVACLKNGNQPVTKKRHRSPLGPQRRIHLRRSKAEGDGDRRCRGRHAAANGRPQSGFHSLRRAGTCVLRGSRNHPLRYRS